MGQKINPNTFRLSQKVQKETKWFLLNNYSDGLHNDIEIKIIEIKISIVFLYKH